VAAAGERKSSQETLHVLRERHEQVAGQLVEGEAFMRLCLKLEDEFQGLHRLLSEVADEGQLWPRAQDHLLGAGELLSSRIVQAAFQNDGVDAAFVDARECVITDAAHTRATPLWEETNRRLQAVLLPLLERGCLPVLGGFVGATQDGIPTTLGRGGSDFSAAIVGAALAAKRIEIWTDVDGVMTTDPNLCPDARRVANMSFDEAAELAYFGAKVLHPATLLPARRCNVPVYVLNSRNPEGSGTKIDAHPTEDGQVKAITVKRSVAVVDIEPVRWLAPELLREVFDVFERHQYPLDLLSASRGGLSLLVSSTESLPAVAEELKGLAYVGWENHKALVCLVGEKIRRRPEIASQVFRNIADIDARMICQGASERNISFLVDESRADEAVRRLHRLFFSSPDIRPAEAPPQAMCQAGGSWQ
jgi:aspartate kinase